MSEKEKPQIDDFGNKLDYNQYDDGEIIRVTQTNRNKQFYVR